MNKAFLSAAVPAVLASASFATATVYTQPVAINESFISTEDFDADESFLVNGSLTVTAGAFKPGIVDLVWAGNDDVDPKPIVTFEALGSGSSFAPGSVSLDSYSTVNVKTATAMGSLVNDGDVVVAGALSVTGNVQNNSRLLLNGGSVTVGGDFTHTSVIRGNGTVGLAAGGASQLVAEVGSGIDPGFLPEDLSGDLSPIGVVSTNQIDSLLNVAYSVDVDFDGSQFLADQIHMQNVSAGGSAIAPWMINVSLSMLPGGADAFAYGDSFVILTADQPLDISDTMFVIDPLNEGWSLVPTLSADQKTLSVVAVPEPTALALLGLGAAGLLRRRRA